MPRPTPVWPRPSALSPDSLEAKTMNDNPLVTEIRKIRAEILNSYQGDYHAMMNAMKQRQWESGH